MLLVEQQASFLLMEKVYDRLATYLLDLAKVAESDQVVLPMKMKELALFLGTTPETLSRKLKRFEEKLWIRRNKRTVWLLDQDQLADL